MITVRHAPACLLALAAGLPATRATAQDACAGKPVGTVAVTQARDGRTLLLADGRELRLAAIETWPHGRTRLQELAAGQTLRLEALGAGRDRYGRLTGFAFPGDTTRSLQRALVEAGEARVAARAGGRACAGALLAAEGATRAAGRGPWADPIFAPLAAKNVPRLQRESGHFVLVEGKVLSARPSGGTIYIIYINFGRRWTRGFAVVTLRRRQREFAAAGVDLRQLEGRRVRVRGWIEQRRGPVIEAEWPEQIELVH